MSESLINQILTEERVPNVLLPEVRARTARRGPSKYYDWEYETLIATKLVEYNVFAAPRKEFPRMPTALQNEYARMPYSGLTGPYVNRTGKLGVDDRQEDCLYFIFTAYGIKNFLTYCENPRRRRVLAQAYTRLGWGDAGTRDVTWAAKRLLRQRRTEAQAAGFPDFLAAQFTNKLEKSPEKILAFLHAEVQKNMPAYLEWFRGLAVAMGSAGPPAINSWDSRYLRELVAPLEGNVEFKHYFELEQFMPKFFAWVGDLFSIRFTPQEDRLPTGKNAYRIYDRTTGQALGRIGFEFFNSQRVLRSMPRGSQYTTYHSHKPNGVGPPNVPAASIVLNLAPATDGRVYFRYDDLLSLAHEMGHALEYVFCRADPAADRDFEPDTVEVTSLFMEELLAQPETLMRLGVHNKTRRPLTRATACAVRANYARDDAVHQNSMLTRSLLDLQLNLAPPAQLRQTGDTLMTATKFNKFNVYNLLMEQKFFETDGYYAGNYYAYALGQVLAKKLAAPFDGLAPPYPPALGQALRERVFAPFGRRSFAVSFHEFTGKPLAW